MRFSVCYTALNEEQFLPHSLKSTYDFADEIIIVEGARGQYWQRYANADGSSMDNTVQLIKSFPDPNGKIKLFQGKWKDKLQMKNLLLKHSTGDWILLCGADEIYNPVELETLKQFVLEHPQSICIKYPFIHFIWDENHQIVTRQPSPRVRDWSSRHQRFFKTMPGQRYQLSHSDVQDKYGRLLISGIYKHSQHWLPNVHVFHYGYTRSPEQIIIKLRFYSARDGVHIKHGYSNVEAYIKSHPYFSRKTLPGEQIIAYNGKKLGVVQPSKSPSSYRFLL